jgi:glycosyltransferase involved in cell wall biosynthesis
VSRTPQISAVIDTFNHGAMLDQAVRSVLDQDFPAEEYEILVVDDGSTDDTPARVQKYGDRVRYLRKENGGQASAFNLAFAESRGEILAFLDGDDWWLPEKLRAVADAFRHHPETGLVYHPCAILDESTQTMYDGRYGQDISGFLPATPERLLLFRGAATTGLAFRRSVLAELMPIPEDIRLYADGYMEFLAALITPVRLMNNCLAIFRRHQRNLVNIDRPSLASRRNQAQAARATLNGMKAWLAGRCVSLAPESLERYLLHHELWVRGREFEVEAPGRRAYARYLLRMISLYWPHWPWRQKVYRALHAAAGMALGYGSMQRLRLLASKIGPTWSYRGWLSGKGQKVLPGGSAWQRPAA